MISAVTALTLADLTVTVVRPIGPVRFLNFIANRCLVTFFVPASSRCRELPLADVPQVIQDSVQRVNDPPVQFVLAFLSH